MAENRRYQYYEFFAGGGMVRAGLGPHWTCTLANDIDRGKADAYAANFGSAALRCGDVADLTPADAPGRADLAWASFPCQDLSLAGARSGLAGARSGTFFAFWALMEALARQGRAPRTLVIENVVGFLTSRGGRDFAAVLALLAEAGYAVTAQVIDARLFVPQSRPRLFVVAWLAPLAAPSLERPPPGTPGAPRAAVEAAPPALRRVWRWTPGPSGFARNVCLADVLEPDGAVPWRTPAQTERLLAQMAPRHAAETQRRRAAGGRHMGAAFRRMRQESGLKVQRAEVRFDGLAGCLRTPAGGSSRQMILVLDEGAARSRWLTPRECARLMGLPDDYRLPAATTAALHLLGDGVAAPVARWVVETLVEPALAGAGDGQAAA